jgi:hypothetical protein
MRFLRHAYLKQTTKEEVVSQDKFASLFSRIQIRDDQFTSDVFKPGTSGETLMFNSFIAQALVIA